jgi:LysM repeat protein
MKKSLLLAAIFFFSISIFAQAQLLVQHNDKGLFLNHKVAAKESFYSIGRLYNIAPKDIAELNGLDMNHGLTIGQAIKIPLNGTNFSQTSNNGKPIYYVVGQKEGLYRVSQNNNNVLMADLRKWNKLTKDNISTGQKLIIGYLVSAEANNIVQKNEEPEIKKTKPVEEPKKEEIVKKDPPVVKKEEVIMKEEKKIDPPIKNTEVAVSDGKGGYFKSQYDAQLKTQAAKVDETASAGIFKTASGWQDAKYYALMDNVEPGTIIKIINPTNSKSIYAKVLGEMSGIRQNVGYDVRISNAAASALEVSDTNKFIVKVNY